MRTLFFSVLIQIALHPAFSQNKNDSIEFQSYYEKAYRLRTIHTDSAFYWIEKSQETAQRTGKKEWLAKTFNLKGVLHHKKSEYLKSLNELEKALKYTNNKELKGKIYINLGNTLSDLGYNYSAIEYYKEAVRIFNETDNQQFLVRALMNLAGEEFNVKHTVNARNHLKLALYYAQEYELLEEEAMCLNNLSAFFIKSGLVDSASRYVYQSFNVYEQTENYFGLADAYLTAIELHLEKKEWDYAKALIDLADSIINSIQYLEGKKILTSEKVNLFLNTNDTESAKKFFNLYLRLEDSLNRKKSEGDKIQVSSITENSESSIVHNPHKSFSFIQLLMIVCISVCIFVFVIKNYRYVKE